MFRLFKINNLKIIPRAYALTWYRSLKKNIFVKTNNSYEELLALENALGKLAKMQFEVPIIIGEKHIFSGEKQCQKMPHNHRYTLARFCFCDEGQVEIAIQVAMHVKKMWRSVCPSERARIWQKCADIIENEDHYLLNASIMLGQAKTYRQAEEDTFRLVQTLRNNATLLQHLSQIKLDNASDNFYSSFHLRPLDGFIAAIGPFNDTSVSADLAFTPALLGNCVLWKPSKSCILSSFIAFQAMIKAGLPPGIISFMPCRSKLFIDSVTKSSYFAGINFTGTTRTFREIWHNVGTHIHKYKAFPRLVGECSGKNFHFVHESADLLTVAKATVRAAFEYSGQKSNSCSRLYVPESKWHQLKNLLQREIRYIKVGDPCDLTSFTSAIINEYAFERIVTYIDYARQSSSVEIVCGGDFIKTNGYFIMPTILFCPDPFDHLMADEILGPLLSVYVYKNIDFDNALKLIANTSDYAHSGAIFAKDTRIIHHALTMLSMTAGNIYINGKCTGSSLGHMSFGGNRLSGTNDKSSTVYYLLRWTSPQLVKVNFSADYDDYFLTR